MGEWIFDFEDFSCQFIPADVHSVHVSCAVCNHRVCNERVYERTANAVSNDGSQRTVRWSLEATFVA